MNTCFFSPLSKEDRQLLCTAVQKAECGTSGEIRVHIERHCSSLFGRMSPYDRAVRIFNRLKMYRTRDRTGVLIYIAWRDRVLAVIGDTGINEKLPPGTWDYVARNLSWLAENKNLQGGICDAVETVGGMLSAHFPRKSDDTNELPDGVSC